MDDSTASVDQDIAVDESPTEFALREGWNSYIDHTPDEQRSEKEAYAHGFNTSSEALASMLDSTGFPELGRVVRENFKYHGTMGE